MMARRYESYKSAVVRPFFRDHFARLDRQIVLVDALEALNAGPAAIGGLETALADILAAFRLGRTGWLSGLVSRRIDRILFAATKADHLHHGDHDRLEAILSRLVGRAIERARFAGATVDVIALASVRATREGTVTHRGERLPSIIGTPLPGETVDGRVFDGSTEIAMFPGDLPDNPELVFEGGSPLASPLRFVRFRPPKLERTAERHHPLAPPYPARPGAGIPDRRSPDMTKDRRRPAAFELDDLNVTEADYVPGIGARPMLVQDADPFAEAARTAETVAAAVMPRRGLRWSRFLLAALGGLITLGIGLAIDNLIENLFARNDALGWFAVGLAGLAVIALIALAGPRNRRHPPHPQDHPHPCACRRRGRGRRPDGRPRHRPAN